MNLCFFLLVLTLFALAFLTGWNKHVLLLFGVTICLWGSMMWCVILRACFYICVVNRSHTGIHLHRFVMEITKVQTRPDNLPVEFDLDADDPVKTSSNTSKGDSVLAEEGKKDR